MAGNSATVGILRALLTLNTAEFEAGIAKAVDANYKLSRELKLLGRQATQLGSALTQTVTLPIVGMAAAAAKAAIDFESSFAGVGKTVAGVMDNSGRLTSFGKELAQGFRNLAKEIPVSVNELNRIGEAAGQLGIKSQNIIGFTKVVAEMATATNLSSDQAATAMARLANITQMPQDEFGRLGATIVALGADAASTESEIVEYGQRIAGAGKIAGLTVPQILAIGTAMSDVGVEAEAGGTAIQKVLLTMTQAVSDGGEKLQVFAQTAGMSAQQFAAAFKQDAGAAFAAFVAGLGQQGIKATKTLEDLDIADQRLIRGFVSLGGASDLLTKHLQTGAQAWRDQTALTIEAQKRFATTESQLALLWNRLKDVGITLGSVLLPIINNFVQSMTPFVAVLSKAAELFAALPQPVQTTAIAITGILAAVGPVTWAFGQLMLSASTLIGAFTKKGIATKALTGLLSALGITATTTAASTVAVGTAAGAAAPRVTLLAGAIRGLVSATVVGAGLTLLVDALSKIAQEANNASKVDQYGKALADASRGITNALYEEAKAYQQVLINRAKLAQLPTDKDGFRSAGQAAIQTLNELSAAQAKASMASSDAVVSHNAVADAIKRISGQNEAESVKILTSALNEMASKGQVTIGSLQRLAAEAQSLQAQGAKLTPELQNIVNAYGNTATAAGTAAGATDTLRAAVAALTDGQRADIIERKALNQSVQEISKSTGIATGVVKAFLAEQKQGAKDAKAHEKALKDQEQALKELQQKYESLGVQTMPMLNAKLNELFDIEVKLRQAGIDEATIAQRLSGEYQKLHDAAKNSGVGIDLATAALKRNHDAATFLIRDIPMATIAIEDILASMKNVPTDTDAATLATDLLNQAYKTLGLESPAELKKVAQAASDAYEQIARDPSATRQQILDAHNKVIASMIQAIGSLPPAWQKAVDAAAAAYLDIANNPASSRQQIVAAHQQMVDTINAATQTIPTIWNTTVIPALQGLAATMGQALSGAITNLTSWKDAAVNIWKGMQAEAGVIVDDIVNRVFTKLPAGLGAIVPGIQGFIADIGTALQGAVANTTSWKDASIKIWQSFRDQLARIINDIVNNLFRSLMGGLTNLLAGSGSFASGFMGNLGGILGGLLGGAGGGAAGAAGGMFGLPTVFGPGAAGPAIGGGGAAGAGGLFGGGFAGGAATLGIGAGISALLWGIISRGLFRGGEEALHVNQPRDQFIASTVADLLANTTLLQGHGQPGEFGTGAGTGQGSAFHSLAAALQQMGNTGVFGSGAVQGGQAAFQQLLNADTVKEYEAAVANINRLLAQWRQNQQAVNDATEAGADTAQDVADSTTQAADSAAAAAESAEQVADAATQASQVRADELKAAIADYDSQIQSLQQSIANEAPEEVMGVIEAQALAQIQAIQDEQAAAQAELDSLVSTSTQTTQAAIDNTQAAADAAAVATGDTVTQVTDDIITVTDGAVAGIQDTVTLAGDAVVKAGGDAAAAWDVVTDEIFAFANATSSAIYGTALPAMQDLYNMTMLVAQGASPTGFQGMSEEAIRFGRVSRGELGGTTQAMRETYAGTVELAGIFRVLGREVEVTAAQMDKIRREGWNNRQAADWLRDQQRGARELTRDVDGVASAYGRTATAVDDVNESTGRLADSVRGLTGNLQATAAQMDKIRREGWNDRQARDWLQGRRRDVDAVNEAFVRTATSIDGVARETGRLSDAFGELGANLNATAAQLDKIRREGWGDRQARDWLLGQRPDGVRFGDGMSQAMSVVNRPSVDNYGETTWRPSSTSLDATSAASMRGDSVININEGAVQMHFGNVRDAAAFRQMIPELTREMAQHLLHGGEARTQFNAGLGRR